MSDAQVLPQRIGEADLSNPDVARQYYTDTDARCAAIKSCIRSEDKRVRAKYTWLKYQDFLGGGIFVGSVVAMLTISLLYLKLGGGGQEGNASGWWWAALLMALPISILHEMEHDLIHNLYFKKNKVVQDFMFYIIWLCKLHVNPWFRRKIHLWHHAVSGQPNDVEERLVGLGIPFGLRRLAMISHPQAGAYTAREIHDTDGVGDKWLHLGKFMACNMPIAIPFIIITKAFYALGFIRLFFPGFLESLVPGSDFIWVLARDSFILLALPNYFRQGCLNLITTSCHYYGDIPKNDCFYQNQIIDSWITTPFQLFCFNFGSTHIIHHFIPGQPFYLRQMIAPACLAEMKKQGIRHNDMGINFRGNRWVRSKNIGYEEFMGNAYFLVAAAFGIPLTFFTDLFVSAFITKVNVWNRSLKKLFYPRNKRKVN